MAMSIMAFDWTRTSLGPPAAWEPALKALIGVMLASTQPMFIAWGRERVWLYNDAFVPILGRKHPEALGQRGHRRGLARGAVTFSDRCSIVCLQARPFT